MYGHLEYENFEEIHFRNKRAQAVLVQLYQLELLKVTIVTHIQYNCNFRRK